MHRKCVQWTGGREQMAVDLLLEGGRMIVSPTKVGYIIMTTDIGGLTRMFFFEEASSQQARRRAVRVDGAASATLDAERRNRRVLSDGVGQRVLLGCILPWKADAKEHIPHDGSESLMMDQRSTSCFVVKFGAPSELITRALWEDHGTLTFASSANPSGKGNSGRVDGIGGCIHNEADLVIAADDYVRGIQPGANDKTRYEQGVMVSMVDADGRLIPEQRGERSIQAGPVVIRKGLDLERILLLLSTIYPSWDYRHGTYY